MKILQIHNFYLQRGGEDVVYEAEKQLLESHGHTVVRYERNNKEIEQFSLIEKSFLLWRTTWQKRSYFEVKDIIINEKPDICHVHNIMPLISPSVYYACKEMRIPIVQTLHNYRLLCANAYLFRNGKICEECMGKSLYRSVKYGCYRDSRVQTLALARMVEKHKKKRTWNNVVNAYIVLTTFAKEKFIQGGLDERKIFIKPNFLFDDPGFSNTDNDYFFFAGRLDETKGIKLLNTIAQKLPNIKLRVAGDGNFIKSKIDSRIRYLGRLSKEKVLDELKNSKALIFPSIWYEGMPMTVIEAFATGKPVIASKIGSLSEMISDRKTGLLFEPGNEKDLMRMIKWMVNNPHEVKMMGGRARREFELKYTAEKNYNILINIYNKVKSANYQV